MVQTLATVATLLLGLAIMSVGSSLLGITLPLKMTAAGFSTEVIGIVMAAYFGGLLVGSVYAKSLIGRVGHVRTFAGLAAVMSAAALAHPMLINIVSWAILRFIAGICIAGLFAVLESWLNERSTNANRGRVLSVYMIVNYLAIVVGQLTVNVWDLAGSEGFMMAALLISLSLVPVVLTRVEAPDLSGLRPLSLRQLYQASPLAVVGSCAAGLVLGAFWGLGAVFGRQIGLDVLHVSLFTGTVIVGGMLLQWPIGRLSDRYHRRTVLLVILILAVGISAGGIAAASLATPYAALLVLALLFGGTTTAIYPICVSQAFDYLPRDQYVGASSGLLLAYSVGATAGPVVCALAMGALGPWAFFGYAGLVLLLFAGFVGYRMGARAPLPAAEQEPVVIVGRMSPVAAALDPRCEAMPEAAPAREERPATRGEAAR